MVTTLYDDTHSEAGFQAVPCRISLFGPMQVLLDGQPMPHLRSRKALWLLALLALRCDRDVEREWLAGTLWPDVSLTQSYDSLRPRLAELRRAMGGRSEAIKSASRQTLRLDASLCSVDLHEFDLAVESSRTEAWERALALYRGPLLEGCVEEWVFQERGVREQSCLSVLLKLGHVALEVRSYMVAVEYYRRAISMDPFQDIAVRGLMEALSRSGDINAALHAYRAFDNVLLSNRTSPDPETVALYTRLRGSAQTVLRKTIRSVPKSVTAPVSGNLKPMVTRLVGRDNERLDIAERLRHERLMTLTGTGGIGKTCLGQAAAIDAARHFPDGVWMVSLEMLSDSRFVAPHIASVLKLPEQAALTPLQQVAERLEGKEALLVLDNCEHLLEEGCRVVDFLIAACAGLHILATSREALSILGEYVWPVPSLTIPSHVRPPDDPADWPDVLRGYESIELFVQRAQSARADFALTAANGRAVAQICMQMDGIPLAIEMAAARVKVMTVEQIAERLHHRLNLLTDGLRNAPPRQKTMRATLDWSYALLTLKEQEMLNSLSVFVGGCSLDAVELVCDSIDETAVVNLLSSLVDKSLVKVDEQTSVARYSLLETIRQYAEERLRQTGELEPVRGRHMSWCLSVVEEAHPHLTGSDSARWLARIDLERENIRATLVWEAGLAASPASLRLIGAFLPYLTIRGYNQEAHDYVQKALSREGVDATSETYTELLCTAAAVATSLSDLDVARDAHEHCLRITRDQGYPKVTALSLNGLGWVALRQMRLAEARESFLSSLELYRELGDKAGVDQVLYSVAALAYRQSDYAKSETYAEEALQSYRTAGDASWVTNTLNLLGLNSYYQGNFDRANLFQREAAQIQREQGNKGGELALAVSLQGLVAIEQNDAALATRSFSEALTLFRNAGVQDGAAEAISGLGAAAQATGNLTAAAAHHHESLMMRLKLDAKEERVTESLEEIAGLFAITRPMDAVRLWAAAQKSRRDKIVQVCLWKEERLERELAQTRLALGQHAFDTAWQEGAALDLQAASQLALQCLDATEI